MQQHPVPQNVTQYQFRLVGDMTLKQFLELVAGLILAYLFFASNLVFFIKWPLVIMSALAGIGLAFFPVEDRPLDQWIVNFIRSIYAPTRFTWKKTAKTPPLFTFTSRAREETNAVSKTIKAPALMSSAPQKTSLSELESEQLKNINSLFSEQPVIPATNSHEKIVSKPSITIRKLGSQGALDQIKIVKPAPPAPAPNPPEASSQEKVIFTAPSVASISKQEPKVLTKPKNITMPASPKEPNLITGAVVDKEGKLVQGAIVQIVSADGIPARAMKTNSLGQFYTSTPLGAGKYIVEVDKEGLSFLPQQIEVANSVLSPIELRAGA